MGMEVGRGDAPDADAQMQDGLFQLAQIHTDEKGISELQEGAYAAPSEDEGEEEEEGVDTLDYEAQQEEWLEQAHSEYLARRKKRNKEEDEQDMPYLASRAMPGDLEEGEDDEDDEEIDDDAKRQSHSWRKNALLVEKPGSKKKDASAAKKAERFFSNDLFDGLDDDDEEEAYWRQTKEEREKKAEKLKEDQEKAVADEMNAAFDAAVQSGGDSGVSNRAKRKRDEDSTDEDEDDWEAEEAAKEAYREERQKYLPKNENALAETLALGQMMLRKKQRMDIVDASYNRYAFNDDANLPSWFKEEESRHNKPQLPVTRAQIEQMKLQWQAVDARPIKKLAEAKARKKRKKDKLYTNLTRKANAAIAEGSEVQASEREKLLKQLVSKNLGRGGTQKMKTVVSNKGGKARSGDKKGGAKGAKIKVVDKRMKKDTRSQKAALRRAMKGNYGRVPKSMQKNTPKTKSKKEKRAAAMGL